MDTETTDKKPKRTKAAKQTKMPGTERPDVNKDIEKAAAVYVEFRDERMALTKKEVESQAKLLGLMKAAGLMIYRCDTEDLEVEIVPEAEKAKVRRVTPPGVDEEN